jgi:hypothetical protein
MERRWDGNTDGHWGVIADVDGEPALITIEHRQLRVRPITDPHAPGAVIGDSADRIYATWTNGSATNILTSTWEGRRMMVWRNRLSE